MTVEGRPETDSTADAREDESRSERGNESRGERGDESRSERGDESRSERADDDHLSDVPVGSGCTEIWEHLAERREDDE